MFLIHIVAKRILHNREIENRSLMYNSSLNAELAVTFGFEDHLRTYN